MQQGNAAKGGEVETTVTISYSNSTCSILMCSPHLHLFPSHPQVSGPEGSQCSSNLCPTQGLGSSTSQKGEQS